MNNNKKVIFIGVIGLCLFVIGITFAYFSIGNVEPLNVSADVKTYTTDNLLYRVGDNLVIHATQENFGVGQGNITCESSAEITLKANNKDNNAKYTYNLILNIFENEFVHSQNENVPELLLNIKKPDGGILETLDGLVYTTYDGISGFDITTKNGIINIASDFEISTTSETVQKWEFTLIFLNLDADQAVNTNKRFNANIIVRSDDYVVNKSGKQEIYSYLPEVELKSESITDNNYIFNGDEYYLNPYNLDEICSENNFVNDANSSPNACMKWYEVSEDDDTITLMLNSNLGSYISETSNINTTALTQLKSLTDNWDSRLTFSNGFVMDDIDYGGYKARIVSLEEISNLFENPTYTVDYTVNSDIYNSYRWVLDNVDFNARRRGGFVTSTVYDTNNNYIVNKYGIAISGTKGYGYGVRPIIHVKKDLLKLKRNYVPMKNNVTYWPKNVIIKEKLNRDENIKYQIINMRAAGIKKVYLNMGKVSITKNTDGTYYLEDTINSFLTDYNNNVAKIIKIGRDYGVDVIPWINYPHISLTRNSVDYTTDIKYGDYVIAKLAEYVNMMLTNGFTCDADNKVYYPREIHFDGEPMSKKNQEYYLNVVKKISESINNRANLSISSPHGTMFDATYLKDIANYVNSFNVMIYDTMGPITKEEKSYSKLSYINIVKMTANHYMSSLKETYANIYLIGAMYEDTYYESSSSSWPDPNLGRVYSHLNEYFGEEVETLPNLLRAISEINLYNLSGIGFYNWHTFSMYDTSYNSGDYINSTNNYSTIRKYLLNNWTYLK